MQLLNFLHIFDPFSMNEQSVGIDGIGRAGQQRGRILAVLCKQMVHLRGFRDGDFVHLIGQDSVQHRNGEKVTLLQLVQIREESGLGKSPMCRKHGMGAFSAYRETGSLHVSDALCQH